MTVIDKETTQRFEVRFPIDIFNKFKEKLEREYGKHKMNKVLIMLVENYVNEPSQLP